MSEREEAVLRAANAWAAARAELEGTTDVEDTSSEELGSAELAIHSVAERVEALRAAEHVLFETITAPH